MKKYLAVLAFTLFSTAAAAQTGALADPTTPAATPEETAEILPDPTVLNFPRPAYFPHCAGGFYVNKHAVACHRVVSFYLDDTLDTASASFPRPVYKPECVLEGVAAAGAAAPCQRTITFVSPHQPSLALGDF